LQTGTPQDIKDHTKKLIDVVGKDGGYIIACRSSMDEADPALVKVWMDYTKEYGTYGRIGFRMDYCHISILGHKIGFQANRLKHC
jgi:hypothetical protein